ncbi:Riboflavin biosynthesis protein RibD [Chlamydiales bacterium STE3]|nr:Riboflavin biosynthesis protein RibD [Chlamydiales bacterium STE3]
MMSSMKDSFDQQMMLKAIQLGELSRSIAPPNPWVGCIIVKNSKVIGQGATRKIGGAHAEIVALEQAGTHAQGATAYVSLEPCCHHGRTPPCVASLIKYKVARVVVALLDPDSKVNGRGIEQLRQAGIEVVTGIAEREAAISLKPYLYQRKMHLPFVIAKSACSLDGRIAAQDGSSKWISSEAARQDAQVLRKNSQAILIGCRTAIEDSPRLTVRIPHEQKPLRVILDSRGILKAQGPLFDPTLADTLVITTSQTAQLKIEEWREAGALVKKVASDANGKVCLKETLELLNQKGIMQVLCEGGSTIIGSLFKEQLINQFVAYVSPCFLGEKGLPLIKGLSIPNIAKAFPLTYESSKNLDGTVRIDYSM